VGSLLVLSSMGGVSSAMAQSSYTLYGVVDLSLGSFQSSGAEGSTANKHVTKVDGNQMVTSYIGLKGTEDLGGGLKAGFVMETFLRPDTGASGRNDLSTSGGTTTKKADVFWGRASNVWLQSGLGKLVIGRQANLPFTQVVGFNPFGGAFGLSPAVRLTYGAWGNDKGDSGWSNAVTYVTPDLSGFTATVQTQAGEASDGSEGSSYGLGAAYTSGPLSVAGSWQTLRSASDPMLDFVAQRRQTFGLLNASYDAGFSKFFLQYGRIENHGFATTTRIDTSLYQVGAAVPVSSSGKVLASFGQSKEKPVEGGTTPVTLHNILTLAYDHWLSKRTDAYAAVMMDNEKVSGYKKGYSYVLGLRHAF
jgi:predicted porin